MFVNLMNSLFPRLNSNQTSILIDYQHNISRSLESAPLAEPIKVQVINDLPVLGQPHLGQSQPSLFANDFQSGRSWRSTLRKP